MTEDPRGHRPRPDLQPRLRAAALTAVIAGVLLLAAAAFVLSYAGIHRIALAAGVSPSLARFYPLIFDAMLVIAGSAVLATRTAGWGTRAYVWGCLLLLLAGVATGDAVHAMNIALPKQQARAAVAVTPWALLLLAFGLLLAMLRHLRRIRLATLRGREIAAAGHARLAPPNAAAPDTRALPAAEPDAADAAAGVPASGVAANGVTAAEAGEAAAGRVAARDGTARARRSAAEARGAAASRAPSAGRRAGSGIPEAQPSAEASPARADSAGASAGPGAGGGALGNRGPTGAGLGYPPGEGYAAAPMPETGTHPGQGPYPEPGARAAHPGPAGQAGHTGYPDTEEYTEHVVYAEPEIANAGYTGEYEAEPGAAPAEDVARPAEGDAGPAEGGAGSGEGGAGSAEGGAEHGDEETGRGPSAPASAVPPPAPVRPLDRLRSGPTPPQD